MSATEDSVRTRDARRISFVSYRVPIAGLKEASLKLKSTLATVAILLLTLAGLAGCGSNGRPSASAASGHPDPGFCHRECVDKCDCGQRRGRERDGDPMPVCRKGQSGPGADGGRDS
jgi:hypothetical protein